MHIFMATKKLTKGKGAGVNSDKTPSVGSNDESSFTPSGIRLFFQEVLVEFSKIVWPAKKVTAGLTCFVLVLVMFLSFFLGSVDLLLGKLVTFILNFGMN